MNIIYDKLCLCYGQKCHRKDPGQLNFFLIFVQLANNKASDSKFAGIAVSSVRNYKCPVRETISRIDKLKTKPHWTHIVEWT